MELFSTPDWDVFLYALITAAATGLGALPFFFIKELTQTWSRMLWKTPVPGLLPSPSPSPSR